MSALILALFPLVPPPPADWTSTRVVPNPFLPVPSVAPRPHAAGTVTARTGNWVRVDWGDDSRWVPTALLLTTEQAYAIAAYQHAGSWAAGFAWHRAAQLAAARGDAAGLCRLLDRSVLAAPAWSLPVYGRAVARQTAGDPAAAVRDAAAYVARRPDVPDGHRLLVTLLSDAGRHADAVAAADRAAESLPADPAAVRLTVGARAVAGDHATAAAFALQMLARFPDHPEAYLTRAHQRLLNGQTDAGAADMATALALDPAAVPRACEVCEWFANRGQYDAAVACADAIIAEAPNYSPVRHARGMLRLYRQEYAQAEGDLTDYLAAVPGEPGALAARAYCRLNRQKYEEAVADLTAVAGRRPDHPWLRKAVEHLPQVVAHLRATDPPRGRKLAADIDRLTARLGESGVVQASYREGK